MSDAAKHKKAKLLFEQWRAGLANKNRARKNLLDNFDDLFFEFHSNDVPFDVAYEYVEMAAVAHMPTKRQIKWTFKNTKGFGQTEDEFVENWKTLIKSEATNAFFTRYPLESPQDKKRETNLPGGMSRDEYSKQRKYANSFPHLDLSNIPDPEDLAELDDDVSFTLADLEA